MDENTLRIIIADDEEPARDELNHLLNKIENIEITGIASDGIQALNMINEMTPDMAILDIQMPGLDGIALAEKLLKSDSPTLCIFTTAYDAFAVNAFEVHAVDYLLKPLRKTRLEEAVKKVRSRLESKQQKQDTEKDDHEKLKNFISDYFKTRNNSSTPRYISVYDGSRIIPIKTSAILFAEARGRHAWIVTREGEYETRICFKEAENLLSDHPFFSCHRSYIINTDAIETIDLWVNNTYRLKIRGTETPVPVSRGRMDQFKQLMGI
ncbi:MAG: response regulator transcription factor [Spirochaetales bacterium]|nr:response regulator transcription factor [Spirochaetales bacterium]